ncbi:thiosulfate:glutathione sulfurtransferase [Mixophyes fleayi]|uniref:thiosulfate:glutathione sulfurtransferase n=1 Tax=Mixophyes fleayi TaxID=3061075 RepID=UPI003F4E3887
MSAWLGRLCVSVRSAGAHRAVSGAGIRCTRPRPAPPQAFGPSWPVSRSLSVSPATVIEYKDLKDLLKKDGVVLIDVREPWETKEYGIIKGSVNIPLGDLGSALQMTPKVFEEKYAKKLPDKSNTLVFSCLAGIRSRKALTVATSLGYNSVHHYAGGYEDWTRQEKQS